MDTVSPVRIEVQIGGDGRSYEWDLVNASNRTVTAWFVGCTIRFEDGQTVCGSPVRSYIRLWRKSGNKDFFPKRPEYDPDYDRSARLEIARNYRMPTKCEWRRSLKARRAVL
jgi:hypothetical protein